MHFEIFVYSSHKVPVLEGTPPKKNPKKLQKYADINNY